MKNLIRFLIVLLGASYAWSAPNDVKIQQTTATGATVTRVLPASQPIESMADLADELSVAAGGGDALVANPLSQFAATTSAQLRGVMSDEVGTGALYFIGGDLGTPSAIVLTNATGTAASLTAGTATTANAGDSATSFFSTGTIEDARLPVTMDGKTFTGTLGIADTYSVSGATVTITEASPDTGTIAVTELLNVATIDEATTFSFSATPATGVRFGLRVSNSTSSAVVATIPSSFSENTGANITTVDVPGNGTVTLWWERLSSSYAIYGDPQPIVKTAFIPVGWMRDGATAPSAIEDYADTRKVAIRDFSNSADNILEFLWQLPVDIVDGDAGTAGFQVKWRPIYMITTTAPASNEGVTFGLSGASVGDSDDFGATVGTESDVAFANLAGHANGDIVYGTYTAITVTDGAAGEGGVFSLRRDTADSNDDYGQTVGLIGIEVKYKAAATATY